MLMALKYLTCYLATMVQLIMLFLTTTVAVASTTGLLFTVLLIAATAALALIRVTHPPAPPYRVALLFRQVRIALGLLPNLNYIDDVHPKTEVDNHLTATTMTLCYMCRA